jgi:hypothetical protein
MPTLKSKYGATATWIHSTSFAMTSENPEDKAYIRFPSKLEAITYQAIRCTLRSFNHQGSPLIRSVMFERQVRVNNPISAGIGQRTYVADFLLCRSGKIYDVTTDLAAGKPIAKTPFLIIESKGMWLPASKSKTKTLIKNGMLSPENFLIVGNGGDFGEIPNIDLAGITTQAKKVEAIVARLTRIMEAKWG